VIKSSPQVQVNDDNKMIVQIENVDFTGSVSQLDVKSSGVGSIYVQIVQHYYIPDTTVEPFAVEVVVVENDTAVKRRRREADNTKDFCLDIKTKSNDNDVGAGMSLVMVEHPSGYGYKSHSEPDGSEAIKLRESDSDKTTLYFDDLQTEREATVCFAYHTKVANPKPAFVSVQDYYNTEAKSDQQFSLDGRQNENACELCGCACQSECPLQLASCELELTDNEDDDEATTVITWSTNNHELTIPRKLCKLLDRNANLEPVQIKRLLLDAKPKLDLIRTKPTKKCKAIVKTLSSNLPKAVTDIIKKVCKLTRNLKTVKTCTI